MEISDYLRSVPPSVADVERLREVGVPSVADVERLREVGVGFTGQFAQKKWKIKLKKI